MTHELLKKRTAEFSRRVTLFTGPLLKHAETHDVARQLRRAAAGTASNYRAAGLSRSHREFTARMGKVLEEADESVHWLEHLRDTSLARGPELAGLLNEAVELRKVSSKAYWTARGNDRGDGPAQDRPPRRRR